ncbi:MAG: preprotein translocase subunit YajC [Nannocystaceae bacterium]|nr:preprotein translocase subunit YajC [Nannocystaceae bacterium]
MTTSIINLAVLVGTTPALLAEGGPPSFLGNPMFMMVIMFGIIYFMVLRPMSKQEKDRKKRVETLKKGDEVVLAGGMLGRISSVDDEIAMVEIADRVKVRVLKKEISDTRAAAMAKDAKDSKGKDKDKGESKDAKSAS